MAEEITRRPMPERCAHGWRGGPADAPIMTPCPTCGKRSLFIGTGGHLTCAVVATDSTRSCPEPGVERAIEKLKAETERLREAVGLATTAVPDTEMDVDDPVDMMHRVVSGVEQLRTEIERLRSDIRRLTQMGVHAEAEREALAKAGDDMLRWVRSEYRDTWTERWGKVKEGLGE